MLAYSATTKVRVSVNLDCVFAKIPTNVFMVLYANVIRIVAKEASVILNLDVFVKDIEMYAFHISI